MSLYLVGDIHGCFNELKIILNKVKFNLVKDSLWSTGDLVGRGPDSINVLRFFYYLKNKTKITLGNHDLYLIFSYYNLLEKNQKEKNQFFSLFKEPDIDKLITWLRSQPLLIVDKNKKIIMSHAGISPQWNIDTAIQCAREIEKLINNKKCLSFLKQMYEKNNSYNWNKNLCKISRLQFGINVLTKMRYCLKNGQLFMDYINKKKYKNIKPWFSFFKEKCKDYHIFFGHWSAIMGKGTPDNIYGLDTGCCWGKKLTLFRWEDKKIFQIQSKVKEKLS